MSETRWLTEEIARRYLATPAAVDLSQFTEIETAAAVLLAGQKGDLWLQGLTSLSDQAAEWLGSHTGELLLHGLSSLSAPAATALARHNGLLELGMLEPLADDVALILSSFPYELYFETKCISDTPGHLAVARRLVDPETGHHAFWWLESISDEAAEILCECSNFLGMGLTDISDNAAASLRKHRGELRLPSMMSLSDKAAEHLGHHDGLLELTGLATLSEPAARGLARLKDWLMLSRSVQISDEAARALAGCRMLKYCD